MASEFAQEFSKVLKGMEKERISREKKSEDALILRETKREADLTKAEVKQQQQAETDANRQKEINQTLKKFLNKDGNYRKNLSPTYISFSHWPPFEFYISINNQLFFEHRLPK